MKRAMILSLSLCLASLSLSLGCGGAPDAPSSQSPGTSESPMIRCGSAELVTIPHDACEAMDATATPDPENGSCPCMLGYAWNGSACVMLGDCFCKGKDCDKLTKDKTVCEAAHAQCGQKPSATRLSCGDAKLRSTTHNQCAAMDARSVPDAEKGSCPCMLGYAWNGSACVMLGDCFCEGTDCDKLTFDYAACEAAHAQCN